ncbi:hypothetical protein CEXT_29421 [Caerostris extrusa]|uniref:Uncharacterized protein n=1 Tax=Caerostris extrusa TaxID=172846 RepID=A0AAV4XVH4_CAEEX|nr:hypothetical protein CEXT_29421 [Caerostris extrusa]
MGKDSFLLLCPSSLAESRYSFDRVGCGGTNSFGELLSRRRWMVQADTIKTLHHTRKSVTEIFALGERGGHYLLSKEFITDGNLVSNGQLPRRLPSLMERTGEPEWDCLVPSKGHVLDIFKSCHFS